MYDDMQTNKSHIIFFYYFYFNAGANSNAPNKAVVFVYSGQSNQGLVCPLWPTHTLTFFPLRPSSPLGRVHISPMCDHRSGHHP